MKFKGKRIAELAGEIGGCVVMGIISAATQTLWYRIAEPKILDAMDKNDAKQKHPIGFRGGSPKRAPLSFSADFANCIMERRLAQLVRAQLERVEIIGSSPIQPL